MTIRMSTKTRLQNLKLIFIFWRITMQIYNFVSELGADFKKNISPNSAHVQPEQKTGLIFNSTYAYNLPYIRGLRVSTLPPCELEDK